MIIRTYGKLLLQRDLHRCFPAGHQAAVTHLIGCPVAQCLVEHSGKSSAGEERDFSENILIPICH